MKDHDLDATESQRLGLRVREEIARHRMSRQALADMAKVSLSTLEKALAGTRPFTLATIIRIEEALQISLRVQLKGSAAPQEAPDHMGAYSHSAIRWIKGRYLVLRPSFNHPGEIFTYVITIAWDDAKGYLAFEECERTDKRFQQAGYVSMPSQTGHVYLVTNSGGQYRLIVLGRPTIEGTMFGVLTTLQIGHGSQLVPLAASIALARFEEFEDPLLGRVCAETPQHEQYSALLDQANSEDYIRFYA